jgi:hypothetical protein
MAGQAHNCDADILTDSRTTQSIRNSFSAARKSPGGFRNIRCAGSYPQANAVMDKIPHSMDT